MGIFGELTSGLWEDGKNQISEAESIIKITNESSEITFLNAHDYELGMRLYLNNMEIDTGGSPGSWVWFTGWVYVIAITSFTVTVDTNIIEGGRDPSGTVESNETVTGYIALENSLFEVLNYNKKDKIRRRSVINGTKSTKRKGQYSSFTVRVHTLRMDETNRINLSRLLQSYEDDNTSLLFFPHVDENYLKDSSDDGVKFEVEIKFKYLSGSDYRDLMVVTLDSNKYVDLSKNIG